MRRRSLVVGSLGLAFPLRLAIVVACSSTGEGPPSLGTTPGFDGGAHDAHKASDANGDASADAVPESAADAATDVATDTPVDSPPEASPSSDAGDAEVGPEEMDAEAGSGCMQPSDCNSGVCSAGVCANPSCTDKVQNGDETDTDCGGLVCGPCADTKHCDLGRDCKDLVCTLLLDGGVVDDGGAVGYCQAPSCTDGVKNGNETGLDCGGLCSPCGIGGGCSGNGDCTSSSCVNSTCACPRGMVPVTKIGAGGDYCIDVLETSKAEYSAFRTANPLPVNQIPQCSWNTTYTPNTEWPPTLTQTDWNGGEPVRGVNWCDAYAYCAWDNKHLCGEIGGGELPQGAATDDTQSEWFNACSANSVNVFPYGGTYVASNYALTDAGVVLVQPVQCSDITQAQPTSPGHADPGVFLQYGYNDPVNNINTEIFGCQGGETGLYNMSGDVAEWENSCTGDDSGDAGSTDNCLIRGGSYTANQNPNKLSCAYTENVPRQTQDPAIGFRCCL